MKTAPEMGWGDLDNGELLDAMTNQFDALVTVDKGIPRQQSIQHRAFGLIVLRAKSNRLSDLQPLVPSLLTALASLAPGEVKEVSG